ncbi:TolB-like translocation protein [Tenggerimyces flavus]|uniref:PD40 domain-containing protein n=1 Tax=Tenggerimyces flavus TaxID=1708749 RepID=A0ABV7Y8N2_9ACTN|nr:PD40 domain-containing protein [Tenggerimyces flavus]MBM7788417.1 Tol biopolymer transport system component [Tenggerimyces flavus]
MRRSVTLLVVGLLGLGMSVGTAYAAPSTERASVSSAGAQGNDDSGNPAISGSGRYVAFQSGATNLVPGDNGAGFDVFVWDRVAGTTSLASVALGGGYANGGSSEPNLSADGRYVTFSSSASDLVAGDTNGQSDVFVRDLVAGTTVLVTPGGNGFSGRPGISPSGRYVAFIAGASNLVAGDTNGVADAFVADLTTGAIARVSLSTAGVQGNAEAYAMPTAVSDNGRVVFRSGATNLVADDTNGRWDLFVRDTLAGTTVRANLNSSGAQTQGDVFDESISADGRYVSFASYATDLVGGPFVGGPEVYVRDLQLGATSKASVGPAAANGWSDQSSVSPNGRYVTFRSVASNLVAGDTNETADVFLRDRQAATTTRVSVSTSGAQITSGIGNGFPTVSDDGVVAFASDAANLVAGDSNNADDIFVRTR